AGHEAPLQARGEAGAAAAAQGRFLHGGDDLVLRQAFIQDLAQRLVALPRLVVLQAPVGAVQVLVDLRVDVAAMEAGLHARRLELRQHLGGIHACAPLSSSISWSSLSLLMKLHMVRSFTSITGESAQAP